MIKNAIELIKKELLNMPKLPGVYRMLDPNSKVLYVGKAKDLSKRVANYTQANRLNERMRLAISQTAKLEIITTETEAQALLLEASLIKSLKPKYNILLKDDKSMPYILVRTDHDFPQLSKFRGEKKLDGQYFGPFASSKIVEEIIEFLEKTFLLRNCTDYFFSSRKTACMQYQIKRCSAPCVNKIIKQDYAQNVRRVIDFLQGKSINLQQELTKFMQEASEKLEYEKAAIYRDQLKKLNYIQNKNANLFNIENADVVGICSQGSITSIQLFIFRNGQNYGNKSFLYENVEETEINQLLTIFIAQFYQHNTPPKELILPIKPENDDELIENFGFKVTYPKSGEKLKALNFAQNNAEISTNRKLQEKSQNQILLKQVQDLFAIQSPIKRIEVYDNSHIMGTNAVGAMIVATEDGFNKKQYRKYNIKTTNEADDYAMLQEVLTRRLKNLENTPDLMLIDGGVGHLTVAKQVLDSFGLQFPLVCISKGPERNAGRENFHQYGKASFTLDKSLPVMKYLQRLRDEAHRFAVTAHRIKRNNALSFSSLKEIPGVGPKKRKILINHFTSIEEIKNATIDQLCMLEGINQKTAKDIYQFFHN